MLINGEEVRIDYNKGNIGLLIYEQAFNRSLTVDLYNLYDNGTIRPDSLTLLRILFVMTGSNKKTTFEGFLLQLGEDFDALEYIDEITSQAIYSYLPSTRARKPEETLPKSNKWK